MRRRPGMSLVAVMVFAFVAALIAAETFLLFEWSHGAASVEGRRFGDRARLASLAEDGRRWVEAELRAGRLPRTASRPAPGGFDELRLFCAADDSGAVMGVYDLDYDPEHVPQTAWTAAGGDFFPPGAGAFLIRCSKTADDGLNVVLETVFAVHEVELPGGRRRFVLEQIPLLRQEIWGD